MTIFMTSLTCSGAQNDHDPAPVPLHTLVLLSPRAPYVCALPVWVYRCGQCGRDAIAMHANEGPRIAWLSHPYTEIVYDVRPATDDERALFGDVLAIAAATAMPLWPLGNMFSPGLVSTPIMITPHWARECGLCFRMLLQLLALPRMDEWEMLVDHLVDEHLAAIPGYVENCSNCMEWKATAGDPADSLPLGVLPLLGRYDLTHRAGHLLTPHLIEEDR